MSLADRRARRQIFTSDYTKDQLDSDGNPIWRYLLGSGVTCGTSDDAKELCKCLDGFHGLFCVWCMDRKKVDKHACDAHIDRLIDLLERVLPVSLSVVDRASRLIEPTTHNRVVTMNWVKALSHMLDNDKHDASSRLWHFFNTGFAKQVFHLHYYPRIDMESIAWSPHDSLVYQVSSFKAHEELVGRTWIDLINDDQWAPWALDAGIKPETEQLDTLSKLVFCHISNALDILEPFALADKARADALKRLRDERMLKMLEYMRKKKKPAAVPR